jgi:hypothetical protein
MHNRPGTTRHGALLLAASLLLSCDSDDGRLVDDGGLLDSNDPENAELCEQRRSDYRAFLAKHRACESDDDCAVVGDCASHADFDPVRADALKEASQRKMALCDETYDGPTFEPICTANKCELRMHTDTCCGCGVPDAGN